MGREKGEGEGEGEEKEMEREEIRRVGEERGTGKTKI
jgi:hypothetical protein